MDAGHVRCALSVEKMCATVASFTCAMHGRMKHVQPHSPLSDHAQHTVDGVSSAVPVQ